MDIDVLRILSYHPLEEFKEQYFDQNLDRHYYDTIGRLIRNQNNRDTLEWLCIAAIIWGYTTECRFDCSLVLYELISQGKITLNWIYKQPWHTTEKSDWALEYIADMKWLPLKNPGNLVFADIQ